MTKTQFQSIWDRYNEYRYNEYRYNEYRYNEYGKNFVIQGTLRPRITNTIFTSSTARKVWQKLIQLNRTVITKAESLYETA